ncbi:hypothetical protein [Amycolatopsis sp. EV170708-02-1]|nr:hypothetical protein [Amycolatopsis sp. EV170708-02-1]UMP06944.1 hypothetical protein MJQ72_19960 [Amycolatopsis sp. EV170708-02-1]
MTVEIAKSNPLIRASGVLAVDADLAAAGASPVTPKRPDGRSLPPL